MLLKSMDGKLVPSGVAVVKLTTAFGTAEHGGFKTLNRKMMDNRWIEVTTLNAVEALGETQRSGLAPNKLAEKEVAKTKAAATANIALELAK